MGSILMVGCGKMGSIILDGLVNGKLFEKISIIDPNQAALDQLKTRYPNVAFYSSAIPAEPADFVILAVKPHLVVSSLKSIEPNCSVNTVIVSIAAGVSLATLVNHFDCGNFVRVMPNTPCQVGAGYSVICAGAGVNQEAIALVIQVFSSMGRVVCLDESLMDVATALCGSGPGLLLTVLEGLADGALLNGLPKQLATEMAAQAMLGTAKLFLEDANGRHPAQLRDEVCTPGGCTIAGIASLEQNGVRGALIEAITKTAEAVRRLG